MSPLKYELNRVTSEHYGNKRVVAVGYIIAAASQKSVPDEHNH